MSQADATAFRTIQSQQTPPAYLLLTNHDPDAWSAAIDERRRVIGRSRRCDIPLPTVFQHVSRRHAEIHCCRREILIRDLGSRSGTRVNDVWIDKDHEVAVRPGDRIWIGGVELDVVSEIPVGAVTQRELGFDDESIDSIGATQPLRSQLLLASLSQAELAVVMWIGRGYVKDEEIAAKLFRSPNTVRTQINTIFRKLKVRSRTDIIRLLKECD